MTWRSGAIRSGACSEAAELGVGSPESEEVEAVGLLLVSVPSAVLGTGAPDAAQPKVIPAMMIVVVSAFICFHTLTSLSGPARPTSTLVEADPILITRPCAAHDTRRYTAELPKQQLTYHNSSFFSCRRVETDDRGICDL